MIISHAVENKEFCLAVFLDMSQAFNKLWHSGLLQKLNVTLSRQSCKLLTSYLDDRIVFIAVIERNHRSTKSRPRYQNWSMLRPLFYQLLFTKDFPNEFPQSTTIETLADDTAILPTSCNYVKATGDLQTAVTYYVRQAH